MPRVLLLSSLLATSACFDFDTALQTCRDQRRCDVPDAGVTPSEDAGTDAGVDGGEDAGRVAFCSADDWCWENPWPQGNALNAVWAASESDVWFAGERGTLMHWDGSRFEQVSLDAGVTLRGLWGTGPDDVWVVGDGVLFRNDGGSWTPVDDSGAIVAHVSVHGTGPDDVWVAAAAEVVKHWNGKEWEQQVVKDPAVDAYEQFSSIFMAAPDAGWLTTELGNVYHWDGAAWSLQQSFEGTQLACVWSSSPEEAWVGGGDAFLARGSAKGWTQLGGNQPYMTWNGLWGDGAGTLWGVGVNARIGRFADGIFEEDESYVPGGAPYLNAIGGTAPENLWAVGESGVILQRDGEKWVERSSPVRPEFVAIWADEERAFAIGDQRELYRADADGWAPVEDPGFESDDWHVNPTGMWGHGNFVWIVTQSSELAGATRQILRWDGQSLEPENIKASEGSPVSGLLGLRDIWGLRPEELWAVGASGKVLRRQDVLWVEEFAGTAQDLNAVFGTASGDVWIVGNAGTLLHRPPESGWLAQPPFTVENLVGVWASDPEHVWVISDQGGVFAREKGGTWKQWSLPGGRLHAVWGTGPDDVWVAGDYGNAHRWNGSGWDPVDLGSNQDVRAIAGDSRTIWMVGRGGSILSYSRP